MTNYSRLFDNTQGIAASKNPTYKTYKTQEAATKAIEKALEELGVKNACWIMAVNPNGRFHPVVLYSNHEFALNGLPHKGFCIAG